MVAVCRKCYLMPEMFLWNIVNLMKLIKSSCDHNLIFSITLLNPAPASAGLFPQIRSLLFSSQSQVSCLININAGAEEAA